MRYTRPMQWWHKIPLIIFMMNVTVSIAGANAKFKHSYANPEQMLVKDTALDLLIDFDRRVLKGTAKISVKRISGTELWLDTSSLNIKAVSGDIESWEKNFDPEISQGGFGEPLVIKTKNRDNLLISIEYESDSQASGLVWLDAKETRSKEPLMFAVNEPIGARSWFPCQDTPAVRGTYRANLRIIANKRHSKKPLLALIAGENNPKKSNAAMIYNNLKSTQAPIPSYLFVLAAGSFKYRDLGATIGLYADNDKCLDDAMNDFKAVPKYFSELKSMLGDSPWPKQDFLFLPHLEGFVGMENPMLIYFSEELLGASSSGYVAAHELAHMWTGNLVTHKEWNALWLNEAWSTYFEDRVLEAVHGKKFSEANALKTYQDLIAGEKRRLAQTRELPSQPTRMHKLNADQTHPAELIDYSIYPKGSSMLHQIEMIIKREHFDKFAKKYINDFRYVPITSNMFIKYSTEKLSTIRPDIDWDLYLRNWIFKVGMKPDYHRYNTPGDR